MFSKIEVNGPRAHTVFRFLKTNSEFNRNGKIYNIPWNFTKFLVNNEGKIVKYHGHKLDPSELESDIK